MIEHGNLGQAYDDTVRFWTTAALYLFLLSGSFVLIFGIPRCGWCGGRVWPWQQKAYMMLGLRHLWCAQESIELSHRIRAMVSDPDFAALVDESLRDIGEDRSEP